MNRQGGRMVLKFLFICVSFFLLTGMGCEQKSNYAFVYTSSPRVPGENGKGIYPGQDLYKKASDVAFINGGFEETDLELRTLEGKILNVGKHFCTQNTAVVCSAQEGRVSPDGKKIAYSLSYGVKGSNDLVMQSLTYGHLWIYDIASDTSVEIPNQGPTVINRMPDWIDNNTLVYSSNAQNKYTTKDQWNCHQGVYPVGHPKAGQKRAYNGGSCISQTFMYKNMQIWKMSLDGTNQVNLTPHEIMAIRPTVLRHPKNKGRIIFSSWQVAEDKAYYQGSAGPGTITNMWWLMSIDSNGGDQTSIVGAHHSGYINKEFTGVGQKIDQLVAVRSVGEDNLGRIYFTNYYRANHFGLGSPYRITVDDHHVEGCSTQNCYTRTMTPSDKAGSGQFIPKDMMNVAPFGVGLDNMQNRDSQGRSMGKLGYMSRLTDTPDGKHRMLATWGHGWCYIGLDVDATVPVFNDPVKLEAFLGGQPVCDRQIVELSVDQVTDPFDVNQMKLISGQVHKHEWDAQEIAPYEIVPPAPPLTGDKCYLQVVDMRKAELYPLKKEWWLQTMASHVGVQSNAVNSEDPSFHAANIKSLAIYGVELWDVMYPNAKFTSTINYSGFMDKWLIDIMPMEADGSVKVQVPCDTPIQMSGMDANGTIIAHDTTLHSLRKGESRTCYGCHEGHSMEKRRAYAKSAEELFAETLAFPKTPALKTAKQKVSFETQIKPILANRCSTCHAGFQSDSLTWSRVAADQEQLDFPWMTKTKTPNGNYALGRPYFSGLVARHPRWSPLYWGCTNVRSDGFVNSTREQDVDFKEPVGGHKSGATAAECGLIASWIQLGAPNN
jgi:hypothetical protein